LKQNLADGTYTGGTSPPARGRGLKLISAWRRRISVSSPPARGRGLKLDIRLDAGCQKLSPPARGRGLKHEAARDVSED